VATIAPIKTTAPATIPMSSGVDRPLLGSSTTIGSLGVDGVLDPPLALSATTENEYSTPSRSPPTTMGGAAPLTWTLSGMLVAR